jgi:hypothetical protein
MSVQNFETAPPGTSPPQTSLNNSSPGPEVQALIYGQLLCLSLEYKSADQSLDNLGQTGRWNPVVTRPLFELLRV